MPFMEMVQALDEILFSHSCCRRQQERKKEDPTMPSDSPFHCIFLLKFLSGYGLYIIREKELHILLDCEGILQHPVLRFIFNCLQFRSNCSPGTDCRSSAFLNLFSLRLFSCQVMNNW